jgi:primosomal protein N' (replication factor Y) (superfamily II helicase)
VSEIKEAIVEEVRVIAHVAISSPLPRLFDYCVPDHLNVVPGARVLVEFGRRKLVAIVMSTSSQSDFKGKLKPISQCFDEPPVLDAHQLSLVSWLSAYYHYPVGGVCRVVLPNVVFQNKALPESPEGIWRLTEKGEHATKSDVSYVKTKVHALDVLQQGALDFHVLSDQKVLHSTLLALEKQAFVTSETQVIKPANVIPSELILNDEQQQSVDKINAMQNAFGVCLLEGITGSGKTQVYLECIASVLNQGMQALVLVPEIGLTPQTLKRFEARFPAQCVAMHSNLTPKARALAWLSARSGHAKVVIGTRSAIFAPFLSLGIIIIDEEHDMSFKQQDSLRYHARDLAVVRANKLNIPVVMGSATPSLETLYNVQRERYAVSYLTARATKAHMPHYHLIDLRREKIQHGLSQKLLQAIKSHLAKDHQVLLFLNRRGFAPVLLCHQCAWTAKCRQCELSMTYHRHNQTLHCHRCDVITPVPQTCPSCHSPEVISIGVGTERIESALNKLFPGVPTCRVDRDSTRKKGEFQTALDDILAGKVKILIGTQMLAKGHHFPRVAMVGVVDVDGGLFSADFRALERLGQLLVQVAGRAGRDQLQGHVYLQTHQPDHPLLVTLLDKGYNTFAKDLLLEREEAAMPPCQYLALVNVQAKAPGDAMTFLDKLSRKSREKANAIVQCVGPTPAPLAKVGQLYRYQLLFQSPNRAALQATLKALEPTFAAEPNNAKLRWSLDVDPMELY